MEDLLQDFLVEAGDLLSGVDNKLVDLEQNPDDHTLLNEIFRGFHTIKGGAGFLNATELVTFCHLTENLFDKLRNGEMKPPASSWTSSWRPPPACAACSTPSSAACNRAPANPAVSPLEAGSAGELPRPGHRSGRRRTGRRRTVCRAASLRRRSGLEQCSRP
jgi:HPt (histidine-containing phosphotransfer) domain-containing protein